MKKISLFTLSILTSIVNYSFSETAKISEAENKKEKSLPKTNFFRMMQQIQEEFEKEMEEMDKIRKEMYQGFFAFEDDDSTENIKTVKISKETNKNGNKWIVVSIHLPSEAMKQNDVEIKAKGNNLEGSLQLKGYQLEFSIIEGTQLQTSIKYNREDKASNTTKDEKQSEEKYYKFTSQSAQTTVIPYVTNLENAKVTIENDKLILKLPSVDSRHDWTSIKVDQVTEKSVSQEK